MSGICRIGPAGAEPAAVLPRKRAFAASGPPKTDRAAGKGNLRSQNQRLSLQFLGMSDRLASDVHWNGDRLMERARFQDWFSSFDELTPAQHR